MIYRSQEERDANGPDSRMILSKPNAVITYAGTKIINGVDTDIPCVVVGVRAKVNKSELSDSELIPSQLASGSITDVVVFPEIKPITTCISGFGGECPPHGDRYRPLIGGISACYIPYTGLSVSATLGVIAKDLTDGRLVGLTNNHVCGVQYDPNYNIPDGGTVGARSDVIGHNMLQPSNGDGGVSPADVFGRIKRIVPIKFDYPAYVGYNTVEAGIVDIGINDAKTDILDIGPGPFPFFDKADCNVSDFVQKSGRTTGLTPAIYGSDATIYQKYVSVVVEYGSWHSDWAIFHNQMWISSEDRFCQGGDSGSVIAMEIGGVVGIIGLLYASSADGLSTFACYIEDVASALNIESWNGDIVVPHNAASTIDVNGKCYVWQEDTSEPSTHTAGGAWTDCDDCAASL